MTEYRVEFDFYRIDSWDHERFYVHVNGNRVMESPQLYLGTEVTDVHSGSTGVVLWTMTPIAGTFGQYAFQQHASWNEQSFHVVLTIPYGAFATTSSLTLKVTSNVSGSNIENESYGIDNLKIVSVEESEYDVACKCFSADDE